MGGDGVAVACPFCPELGVTNRRARNAGHRIAGKVYVVEPTVEGVSGACHVCRQVRAFAVGVGARVAFVDGAVIRV